MWKGVKMNKKWALAAVVVLAIILAAFLGHWVIAPGSIIE